MTKKIHNYSVDELFIEIRKNNKHFSSNSNLEKKIKLMFDTLIFKLNRSKKLEEGKKNKTNKIFLKKRKNYGTNESSSSEDDELILNKNSNFEKKNQKTNNQPSDQDYQINKSKIPEIENFYQSKNYFILLYS